MEPVSLGNSNSGSTVWLYRVQLRWPVGGLWSRGENSRVVGRGYDYASGIILHLFYYVTI